METCKKPYK